ncbi:MAG TPA: aldehyde dehydrogenase family protein, partial [Xanthobacteraceae bacterium]|nr:aldehyde dehydrogenase family protein [Xanthobacteraceae bacterium]
MLRLTGKSIIGFSRGASDTGAFHGVNPSSGEELEPTYYSATGKEVEAAAQLASSAFEIYGRTRGKDKGLFLRKVVESIEGLGEMLVARASQETGLPPARIKTETARTCFQLRLFAELVEEGSWVDARIDRADPNRTP